MEKTEVPTTPKNPKWFKLIPMFLIVLAVIIILSTKPKTPKNPSEIKSLPVKESTQIRNSVTVDFVAPSTGAVVGREITTEVNIKGADQNKKISGLELTFIADGALKIKDIEAVRPDGGKVNTLKKQVSDQKASIVAVIIDTTNNLPQEVKIKIKVSGATAGNGKLKLDTSTAKIVGNIAENSYSVSQVDESNFTFK